MDGSFRIMDVLEKSITVAAAGARGKMAADLGRISVDEAVLETAGPLIRF